MYINSTPILNLQIYFATECILCLSFPVPMILSSEVVYGVVCECPFPQNGTALQKSLTEYTPSQDGVTVIGYRVVVRARGFHLINDAMIYRGLR